MPEPLNRLLLQVQDWGRVNKVEMTARVGCQAHGPHVIREVYQLEQDHVLSAKGLWLPYVVCSVADRWTDGVV